MAADDLAALRADADAVFDEHVLPKETAITAVTLAELSQGPHLAGDATASAHGLPLYTRNPQDFAGLEGSVDIVAV